MAVLPQDLIAPSGPVEKVMFPGEVTDGDATDLETRLQAYIDKAEVKAAADGFTDPGIDPAVEAWALHLAFEAAHTLAVMRPAREDAQMALLGSTAYDADQRNALYEKAQAYKIDYYDLVDTLATTGGPLSKGVPSHQSKVEYDW